MILSLSKDAVPEPSSAQDTESAAVVPDSSLDSSTLPVSVERPADQPETEDEEKAIVSIIYSMKLKCANTHILCVCVLFLEIVYFRLTFSTT